MEIDIIDDCFYLTPIKYKIPSSSKQVQLPPTERSLTFTRDYVSKFWKDQIVFLRKRDTNIVDWALGEIDRVVNAHRIKTPHIQETDLLRASGPLAHLGILLGPYVGKGYDCFSEFSFLDYPGYNVPVEIKKSSKNFEYQLQKYGKDELSRAVILCARHDLTHVARHIDVIELEAMASFRKNP